MGLTDAWRNCEPTNGPAPLPSLQAFSFLVGLNATIVFVTAATLTWLLSLIGIGASLIATIAGALGFIHSSTILTTLLAEIVFLTAFCLSRLQFRIGGLDFSSLAGRHEGTRQVMIGRLTLRVPDELRGREANFGVWPFQDGDYLYNIKPLKGLHLLMTTVGGAITNPNTVDFIVRDTIGRPATVMCDSDHERFLHCEIDSARKWGGHIGAILGVIAVLIAGLVFAPILAAVEAFCKVPVIGPALCVLAAAILGAVGAMIGGTIGGFVGDGIDALNDPRDEVVEDGLPLNHDSLIQASGLHVTDLDHGHNELHPLDSLRVYGGEPHEEMAGAGVVLRAETGAIGVVHYDD